MNSPVRFSIQWLLPVNFVTLLCGVSQPCGSGLQRFSFSKGLGTHCTPNVPVAEL
jgi:hypothetical protein